MHSKITDAGALPAIPHNVPELPYEKPELGVNYWIADDFFAQKEAVAIANRCFNKKEFYKLLDKEGVSIEQMNTIDDRLQDWQDEDNLVRIEGAERGDFTEPFLPTNMAFQSKKELGYIINDKALLDRISPFLAFYSSDYIVRQYMPNSLYSFLDLPVPEDQGMEAIDTYPSGRYQIIISYDKDLSITKKFTLLRGVSTFRPFFITNDELVFQ